LWWSLTGVGRRAEIVKVQKKGGVLKEGGEVNNTLGEGQKKRLGGISSPLASSWGKKSGRGREDRRVENLSPPPR